MLLTALDDRASMRRGMTAGADDHLAAFTRVELLDACRAWLKKKQQRVETVQNAVTHEEYPRLPCRKSGGCLPRSSGLKCPAVR